jgi:uncharacterized protein YydD (DUF2326 family)
MILKKLYSEPLGLFRSGKPGNPHTIFFKDGVNFIFGKKDNVTHESKQPLNGIGKSTVADLIDFCLLADFSTKNIRLFKEKERLENYKIILEFEATGNDYIIKRNVNDNNNVEFGFIHQEEEIPIKEAKAKLFNIMFRNDGYEGITDDKWYRSLMSFFLKIHKRKNNRSEFADPIKYLTAFNNSSELNQFHFFLLGFDNSLICKNFELQKDARKRDTAISQVKKLVEKSYGITIKDVDIQISKLRNEIVKTKASIDAFELAERHKDVEMKLNELTMQIKNLSEQNFWMDKKIKSYKESYELKDILSDSKIKGIEMLYAEVSEQLSSIVRKSLQEAVGFRKKIANSREEFLKKEIQQLETEVRKNEKEKNELDDHRQKLFLLLRCGLKNNE